MTFLIRTDISVLDVVIVIISRDAPIVWTSVPLPILSWEPIVAIRRVNICPSVIVSCIVVVEVAVVTLTKVVIVRRGVVPLKVVLSL